MKTTIMILAVLVCALWSGCERYHKIDDDLIEDRFNGKIYTYQYTGGIGANATYQLVEVPKP